MASEVKADRPTLAGSEDPLASTTDDAQRAEGGRSREWGLSSWLFGSSRRSEDAAADTEKDTALAASIDGSAVDAVADGDAKDAPSEDAPPEDAPKGATGLRYWLGFSKNPDAAPDENADGAAGETAEKEEPPQESWFSRWTKRNPAPVIELDPEAKLKHKFDELRDADEKVAKVKTSPYLHELFHEEGRGLLTDEQVEFLFLQEPAAQLSYDRFRLLAQFPQRCFILHEVPGIGWVSVAMGDSMGTLMYAEYTDQEIKDAFDKVDVFSVGTLDRNDLCTALRHLGKSDRQVQKLVDYARSDEISLEDFTELVRPGPKPYLYWLGPMPMPNHEKVLDTPVLGHTLKFAGELLVEPVDSLLRRSWRASNVPTDTHLAKTFKKMDAHSAGKLDERELKNALRMQGQTENEIDDAVLRFEDGATLYEFKELVRGKRFYPSTLTYIPIVGTALSDNVFSNFSEVVFDEDDIKEAFDHFDKDKDQKLDKTQVAFLARELGKSEYKVQDLVDSMDVDQIDFDSVKDLLCEEKPRPYLTEVLGIPVPNPAKVHDIPILGNATKLAQTSTYEIYDWTLGLGLRTFQCVSQQDAKAKFEELDVKNTGILSQLEVARALRELGHTERQIARMCEEVPRDGMTLDGFMVLLAPGYLPAYAGGPYEYTHGDDEAGAKKATA